MIHATLTSFLKKYAIVVYFFIVNILFFACASSSTSSPTVEDDMPHIPKPLREIRGAWIPSIYNLDWPSKTNLSIAQQKKEAIALLDTMQSLHMNTVVLQVRPMGDALYISNIVPWSHVLTGTQGKNPGYDPLRFWLDEAHKRGLMVHAWLNPYRIGIPSIPPKDHSKKSLIHKNFAVQLKSGYQWLDPGNPETLIHIKNVLQELLKRYDIDGIQFDDYFYPYSEMLENQPFPDDASYQAYVKNHKSPLNRDDWRRQNINTLIQTTYQTIQAHSSRVLFGVAPFGIWRPNHPKNIKGKDPYTELYTDSKLWLQEGWLDYLSPQLYWPINQIAQSFPLLLAWWHSVNTQNRQLWPGINITYEGIKDNLRVYEYSGQVLITRGFLQNNTGTMQFRLSWLMENVGGLADYWRDKLYPQQAIIPHLTHKKPLPVSMDTHSITPLYNSQQIEKNINSVTYNNRMPVKDAANSPSITHWKINWQWNNSQLLVNQLIYLYDNKKRTWSYFITSAQKEQYIIPYNPVVTAVMIVGVDAYGNLHYDKIIKT